MSIAEGFPGQRILVLPRPRVQQALRTPGTTHLTVTDCGYFPDAHAHGRQRDEPIRQAVVMICASGRGWCEMGQARHLVAQDQVVILPPGRPHSYGANPEQPWTLWWLHVEGALLPAFLDSVRMTEDAPVRTLAEPARALALVAEVLTAMERDETQVSLLAASGAAWHLLTLLASDQAEAGPGAQQADAIDSAAEFLREHVADRVSVSDLAARARLSPSHFATLFTRRTGIPVLQYQTQLRMARARVLLDTTDLAVGHVASEVGYADSFYFSRQFKQAHGLTPRDYRRR